MTTTELVAHLDAHGLDPRETGPNKWRSRCPAHDNRHTLTLSITESGDGSTLLYCFGGCEKPAIVAAVGLRLADLFADEPTNPYGNEVRKLPRKAREPRELRGADRLLDAVLGAGGTYRPAAHDGTWIATCPVCRQSTLLIVEDSGYDRLETPQPPARASCMAGCDEDAVRGGLAV